MRRVGSYLCRQVGCCRSGDGGQRRIALVLLCRSRAAVVVGGTPDARRAKQPGERRTPARKGDNLGQPALHEAAAASGAAGGGGPAWHCFWRPVTPAHLGPYVCQIAPCAARAAADAGLRRRARPYRGAIAGLAAAGGGETDYMIQEVSDSDDVNNYIEAFDRTVDAALEPADTTIYLKQFAERLE